MKRILLLTVMFIGIHARDISDWATVGYNTINSLQAFVKPVREYRQVKKDIKERLNKSYIPADKKNDRVLYVRLHMLQDTNCLAYAILKADDHVKYKFADQENPIYWHKKIYESDKKNYTTNDLWNLKRAYNNYMMENSYSEQSKKYISQTDALLKMLLWSSSKSRQPFGVSISGRTETERNG